MTQFIKSFNELEKCDVTSQPFSSEISHHTETYPALCSNTLHQKENVTC